MSIKVNVIFYSMYGHVYKMAEAVAAGAKEVSGAQVSVFQVAELIPNDHQFSHHAAASWYDHRRRSLQRVGTHQHGGHQRRNTLRRHHARRSRRLAPAPENELKIARFQGRHVAEIATKLLR